MTKKKTKTQANKTKAPEIVSDNTKLQLTLAWKEIKDKYDQVLKNSAKNVKAQGFRKGKVPLKIAEDVLGKDKLINKVLELIVPDKYEELIKKENKKPLTQPQIMPLKMNWGEDWDLEIQIAEQPKLNLADYKKAIQAGLKEAKKQLKETKKAKEKQAKTKKDEKTHDHSHHGHSHDHDEKSRAREVTLHQIFKALVEKVQPKIPELLLKEETKREIQRLAKELEKIGLTLEDYLAKRKQKFEDMSSQVAAQVLGQLQLEFILRELELKEKIEVTQKNIEKELGKIEDEKLREQIKNNQQYLDQLKKQIARTKLLDKLVKTA